MTTPRIVPTVAARVADPLYSRAEAATYLGVKPGTLDVWSTTGRYDLPFIKVGQRAKYRKSDLDRWLESRVATVREAAA